MEYIKDNSFGSDELMGIIKVLKLNPDNTDVRRAQNRLYELYHERMSSVVRRTIECPYIADEILDDGWLRIFKKIELFTFQGSFEGWMRRIMRNAVSDAVANDPRIKGSYGGGWGRSVGLDCREVMSKCVSFDDNLDYKELQVMMWRLPNVTGKVFRAFVGGIKHTEIAKELGMKVSTSKWHVSEARILLKKIIEN